MNKKIKKSKAYFVFNIVWWFLVIIFEILLPATYLVLSFMEIIKIESEVRDIFPFVVLPILLFILSFLLLIRLLFYWFSTKKLIIAKEILKNELKNFNWKNWIKKHKDLRARKISTKQINNNEKRSEN